MKMEETQNKRGRKPKEKFSIFSQRLSRLIFSSYKNLNVIAEEMGITRQSLAQYRDGNNIPDALTLTKIADYFNVSADYLLGRTDVKSANVDLKAVCEYTGLSETAIFQLRTINKLCYNKVVRENEIVSDFISAADFDDLIYEISRAIHVLNTDFEDESEAEMWLAYAKLFQMRYDNYTDLSNIIAKQYARSAETLSTVIIDNIIAKYSNTHLLIQTNDYKGVSENGSNNPPKE